MNPVAFRKRLRRAAPLPTRLYVPDFITDPAKLDAIASTGEGRELLAVFADYLEEVSELTRANQVVADQVIATVNAKIGRVAA